MITSTYYIMKRRLGGEKLTPQDKLMKHRWWQCPGYCDHKHPRRKALFNRYVNLPQKAWLIYWRMHPKELPI